MAAILPINEFDIYDKDEQYQLITGNIYSDNMNKSILFSFTITNPSERKYQSNLMLYTTSIQAYW